MKYTGNHPREWSGGEELLPNRVAGRDRYYSVMNGAVCGYWDERNPAYRLAQFNPAAYLLWEPDENAPYAPNDYNDGSSFPDLNEGPSGRHQGGCIVLSFDGHVEFYKQAVFIAQQTMHPGLLWCDPGETNGGSD